MADRPPSGADVVVIGAGIVGCSAAYHLAAAGAGAVLVVDREDAVGRGSTGACAGGFRQQFTSEVNIRLYGKTAVLTGFVDVKPAKGERYRVRTLEVYLENNGQWQMAQKESVRVPLK